MPPKKKVDLPDHVRAAVLSDVGLSFHQRNDADDSLKLRIYYAVEQGLTTQEIADQLGISQTSASKYRTQGEEIHKRREQARDLGIDEDPHRPAEREPVG